MAALDISRVTSELRNIQRSSKVVAKLLQQSLEALEADPGQFPELEHVDNTVAQRYQNAKFRKVYVEHGKHMFRLVVVHWILNVEPDEPDERVDVIYAFSRKKGYRIDWDWVAQVCRGD